MTVLAALTEEECYLWAIFSDHAGIDQMEFMIYDPAYKIEEKDGSVTQGLFRAWPFQVAWWRDRNPLVIAQGSRCISEDTPVLTEHGWCPIQEVQVGDLVLTHKGRWRRVIEVFDNGVKDVVRCSVGDKFSVICTIDHLFYVGDDYWVEAQSLNGTEVACFVGDEIQFLEVDYVGQELPASTWDLEVEEDHSFVANGMVVHNSAGKSLSCCAAALAFPFCYPGEEMVITAPENVHLQALTDKIETMYINNRIPREMLVRGVHGIKHKPYLQNLRNGARIMGRIPQRDGRGVKGCVWAKEPVLTAEGFKEAGDVVAGDKVINHNGEWAEVTEVIHDTNHCYRVEGVASYPIVVSWEHRFYGASNLSGPKEKRRMSEMYFETVENLLESNFHWATPMKFPAPCVLSVPEDQRVDIFFSHVSHGTFSSYDKNLMAMIQLLGQSLGFQVTKRTETSIQFGVANPDQVYGDYLLDEITSVTDVGEQEVVNLIVKDGHSYLSGTIMSHNVHPAVLLLDEACFTGDTLILTERGQIPIKDVLVGDRVLTHKGNWKTVLAVLDHGIKDTLTLSGEKHFSVECTPNHHFWAKASLDAEPEWIPARDMVGKFCLTKDGISIEVVSVMLGKPKVVYDLTVEDDSSYVANNVLVHNSDYPELAWNELIETVNQSSENAQWKAFGVTRGVRDKFYEYTTSDNWRVYRLPAMYRPTWSDEERAAKVAQYGSEDNVDYRRNILGVHSDAVSPIFSATQLGRCFVGETPVALMAEDERLDAGHHVALIPISDVSVGDVILNAVGSGTVTRRVVSEHDEIYEIRVRGESIYGTGDHPVFTRRGWVPIRDLTTDDEIITADGLPQLWEGLLCEEGEREVLLKSLMDARDR